MAIETTVTTENFTDNTYEFPKTDGENTWTWTSASAPNGSLGHIVSAPIPHDGVSEISFELTVSNNSSSSYVEVDWCTSSEGGFDFLKIFIDDIEVFAESGLKQGTFTSSDLDVGTHILRFQYIKDFGATGNEDKVYISEIRHSVTTGETIQLSALKASTGDSIPVYKLRGAGNQQVQMFL
jgi:hypothetical protein